MSNGNGGELSSEQKNVINSYLFKWFTALGIVNVAALVSGLSYIFFVIPQEAANKANSLISSEISEEIKKQITPISQSALQSISQASEIAMKSTSGALAESARVQERVALIDEEAKRLADAVRNFRVQVSEIKHDDAIKIKEVSDLLLKNPNTENTFNLLARVSSLERKTQGMPDGLNSPFFDKVTKVVDNGELPWKNFCVLSPVINSCPQGFTDRGNFYACFPNESTLGSNATGMVCGGPYDDRHITVCCR